MKYAFFHIKHLLAHLLMNFKIECLDNDLKVWNFYQFYDNFDLIIDFFLKDKKNEPKINSNDLIECKLQIKFIKHYNNYTKTDL